MRRKSDCWEAAFFVVYAVGRIVNGALSDNVKPWIMLTIGLSGCAISNVLFGFLPPFFAITLLWIMNAYAQSMLWSSVLCTVSAIYENGEVKKKSSIMVTSVALGNILGIVINSFLITRFGVSLAFFVPGVITLAAALLTFFATKNIGVKSVREKTKTPFVELLKNKELLMMDIAAMFHGVMKENISLWMAVYIVDTYRVDLAQSSLYILLIPTIGLVGRIAYPFLYKLCKSNEHTVSLVGFVFCVAASSLLCVKGIGAFASVFMLGIIYTAISVINTSVVSIYPLSYAKRGHTAAVSGIMDFSTYLGAGISSAIYGYVIKSFGYMPMFVSWIVLSGISVGIVYFIKRSSCNCDTDVI